MIATDWRYTFEEYLRIEQGSDVRHVFDRGRVETMPVTSGDHSLIAANFVAEAGRALRGPDLIPLGCGLRLGLESASRTLYADGSIFRRPLHTDTRDPDGHTFLNPIVVCEVVSPQSAAFDLGEKFRCYRSIDSLLEYLLIEETRPEATVFERRPDGDWSIRASVGLDAAVRLNSVGVELSMRELYAGVSLLPSERPAT
jgi:Uma2 family endonuclease